MLLDKPAIMELDPLPLETIRNLFALDLPDVYQQELSFQASLTLRQLTSAILRSNELDQTADEFDAAADNPVEQDYSIGCVSTPAGSCFAYARFRGENGIPNLVFMSAAIEMTVNKQGKPYYNIDLHSIITGIESEDNGQQYFDPAVCLCLVTTDDEDGTTNTQLNEPQDKEECYASLCYIQQSLAVCLSGGALDCITNQCWLDPLMQEHAYQEFTKIVGSTSVQEIITKHLGYLEMIEEIIAEISEEFGDSDMPENSPKPYMM